MKQCSRFGFGELDAGVLVLDAEQELAVAAEPEDLRDARVRAVGADDESRGAGVAEIEAALRALRRDERRLVRDDGAGLDGPLGQPAHQLRCIRREEVVAGRGEVDVPETRRIEPHAIDASDDRRRQAIEQRDLIDRRP